VRQPAFIGPGYTLPSPNVSVQNCRNFILEKNELGGDKNAESYYLRSRPKLVLLGTLDAGPTRGGFTASNGRTFVVSKNTLYELTAPATAISYGNLNTSSGRVRMSDNGTQLLVVDGTNGYILTFATNVFAAITDADFPVATHCAFLDQYFLVNSVGTKRFHFALADGTDWDGLDFFSKEGYPDDLLALDVDHGEIILLGRESGEVWYNDGSSPFARRADARIDQGIAAAQTLVGLDNTRFWASRDRNGYGIMSRLSGYSPQRVSQFAIEYLLSKFGDISGGTAFTLQYGGHSLLVLNFPGATTTIVFDAATGAWHEWDYTKLSGGTGRFRGDWHAMNGTTHIVGDYENGNIYELQDPYINSSTPYTDNDAPITRERTAPHVSSEGNRIAIPKVTFDVEVGIGRPSGSVDAIDPQLMFQYSKDGGHTWSNWKQKSLGKQGEYRTRVDFRRLGLFRDYVARVRVTSPVPVTLISAFGQGKAGQN
jgi:hypothetical protein